VKSFDVSSYLTLSFIATGLFLWAVYIKSSHKVVDVIKNKTALKIGFMSLLYGIAYICYYSAYKVGNNAAQMASLFQTTSILTVLLAIVILREKSKLVIKLIAAVISFIGILLVK